MAARLTTEVRVERHGVEQWHETLSGPAPTTTEGDPSGLQCIADKVDRYATACIYCGSTEGLSAEHVIPYALAGTLQIHGGSCETCREITQRFEGVVLRGELRNVRRLKGLPSRSRHVGADDSQRLTLRKEDCEVVADVDVSNSPILLSFPLYPELARGESSALKLAGNATIAYGVEAESFLEAHGATEITWKATATQPVAFAQLLAKIAYGYACAEGLTDYIDGTKDLVEAFLRQPLTLGRFVGTLPDVYKRYKGVLHRLEFVWHPKCIVCLEVQVFAEAGAPTYVIALGNADLRAWRRIRHTLAASYKY